MTDVDLDALLKAEIARDGGIHACLIIGDLKKCGQVTSQKFADGPDGLRKGLASSLVGAARLTIVGGVQRVGGAVRSAFEVADLKAGDIGERLAGGTKAPANAAAAHEAGLRRVKVVANNRLAAGGLDRRLTQAESAADRVHGRGCSEGVAMHNVGPQSATGQGRMAGRAALRVGLGVAAGGAALGAASALSPSPKPPTKGRMVKAAPCWSRYRQLGMKRKGKKQVPNCVPEGK